MIFVSGKMNLVKRIFIPVIPENCLPWHIRTGSEKRSLKEKMNISWPTEQGRFFRISQSADRLAEAKNHLCSPALHQQHQGNATVEVEEGRKIRGIP